MNTKEIVGFLAFSAIIIGGAIAESAYDKHLKHECRVEAIKALTDVSRINEICK